MTPLLDYKSLAKAVSRWCGRPSTFFLAVGVIAVWIVLMWVYARAMLRRGVLR